MEKLVSGSAQQDQRILDIVAEALKRSPESRVDFLLENAGLDPLALAEAQSLLAFHAASEVLDSTLPLHGFAVRRDRERTT
jgi:hypothetical protein